MIVFDMLRWWYSTAWLEQIRRMHARATSILGAFSVGLLSRTLFSPFRQIDAGQVRGSLGIQLHASFDRTFSRFIGFWVRLIVIISGCISALFLWFAGILWIILWPLLPILPVFGAALAIIGWTF